MSIPLYDVSIPVFERALQNMSGFLEKARTWADETGLERDELLNARLYPDMEPLTAQVLQACRTAREAAERIASKEPLAMPEAPASFDGLEVCITETLGYLDGVSRESVHGGEDETGLARQLTRFDVPSFYFHVAMAFAILRHLGAPVAKPDFISERYMP